MLKVIDSRGTIRIINFSPFKLIADVASSHNFLRHERLSDNKQEKDVNNHSLIERINNSGKKAIA
jgi:hypothetical protein